MNFTILQLGTTERENVAYLWITSLLAHQLVDELHTSSPHTSSNQRWKYRRTPQFRLSITTPFNIYFSVK
jgi:hypothetical protein